MNELNGFDLGTSINKYKKAYGVTSADEIYELLLQEYNDDIDNQRKKKIKVKREKLKIEKSKKTFIKNNTDVLKELSMSSLRKDLQKFIGKNVVVDYIVNKKLVQSRNYAIPNNFSSWWKKHSRDWWRDSEITLFEDNDNEGECFIYEEKTNINSQQIIQHFLDGINHCVFTPIEFCRML
jgi:hypothetical protein